MGDSGPPCGVPSSAGWPVPPSVTPAFRKARMSLSTRLSVKGARIRHAMLSPQLLELFARLVAYRAAPSLLAIIELGEAKPSHRYR